MNVLNRMMSYDKVKNVNQKCDCEECANVKSENQTVEYPPLTEEEIEQIIKERYSDKDEKTKTFIRKALRKHGDRYDYSNVLYVTCDINVEIICRVENHKPFLQSPDCHLHGNHNRGSGCSLCKNEKLANDRRKSLNQFIKEANEIHGVGTYDYSKVNYVNIYTEVIIICPIHGEFPQTPNCHKQGQGCPDCGEEKMLKIANDKRLTLKEFIEKANNVHGEGTYDYSKVKYINYSTEVMIICPIHGEFPQTPRDHLSGCGCRKCNKNKGENAIRNFLIKHEIKFEEQKKFEGCKNVYPLRFDFYLPKYNLCIESDGNIHFKKINWNGKMTEKQMKERLKNTQFRDQIKNEYCKKNGITLLRVNNLRAYEEVEKYFQGNNLLK